MASMFERSGWDKRMFALNTSWLWEAWLELLAVLLMLRVPVAWWAWVDPNAVQQQLAPYPHTMLASWGAQLPSSTTCHLNPLGWRPARLRTLLNLVCSVPIRVHATPQDRSASEG